MKHIVTTLFFVMLAGFAAQAQGSGAPEKMDSLQRVLKNARTDAERASVLVQLGEACDVLDNMKYALPLMEIIEKELPKTKDRAGIAKLLDQRSRAVEFITFYYRVTKKADPQSIVDEYQKHIAICKKYDYQEGATNTLFLLANGYRAMGKPLERLNCLKEARDLMKKQGDQKGQSRAILELGFFYAEYGDTSKAVACLREGQEMEKKIGDSTRISRGHFIIGKFYASISWYEKALEHFAQAATRYERVADTTQLLQVYYQTANAYLALKNPEKALEYYQACHDMAIAHKGNDILDASIIGIGDAFFQQKKYKEAIALHKSIYDRYQQTGADGLFFVTLHLAADYAQLKDYARARPLAHQALDLVYKSDYAPEVMSTERMVYQLDSAAGDYKSAFEHYQKYLAYKKMNYDQSVQKASVQEKFQNDLEKQNREAAARQKKRDALAAAESRQQKRILLIIGVCLLLVLLVSAYIFRSLRIRNKQHKIILEQNQKLEDSFKNIEVIGKIGSEITSTLSLDEVINLLYSYINHVMDASGFTLYLYDPGTRHLESKYKIGDYKEVSRNSIPVDSETSFSTRVFKTGKEIMVNDFLAEYHQFTPEITRYYKEKYIQNKQDAAVMQSFITIPLFLQDKCIGVINAYSFEKNVYTKSHLEILKSLASYIAIALNNADAFSRLNSAHLEIKEQKHLVEEKQKEIIESISYAKYLQEAILPAQQFIDENIPENFILYKPKDIVAGDFYWAEKIDDLFFIAAADSTGHGVPGAMVSVVCSNALNRTVKEFRLLETDKILDKTRELVLETFEKSMNQVKDGMDISLMCIDLKSKTVSWSGANNSLWYIRDNTPHEIKADKQPIGKTDHPQPFRSHQLDHHGKTTFYLFTDGYADQFGGPKGKKLKYKTMEEKLLAIHALPMSEQKLIMDQLIEEWMGELEQNDDICLIGVRI